MKIVFASLVLVLGGILGAAFAGVIDLPGITPKKKQAEAAALYAEGSRQEVSAPTRRAGTPAGEPTSARVAAGAREVLPDSSGRIRQSPTPAAARQPEKKPEDAKPSELETGDPFAGQKKLAKVWEKLSSSDIAKIVADWSEEELAKQVFVLHPNLASQLLAKLEPRQASRISKRIQALADKQARAEARSSQGA